MVFFQNILLNVVNMSMTASIIIVFVLFVRLLLKRCPKIFSYVLWSVVLFRLLCPVSITTNFALLSLFHLSATEEIGNVTSIAYIPEDVVITQLSERLVGGKFSEQQEKISGVYDNIIHRTEEDVTIGDNVVTPVFEWSPLMVTIVVWLIGMVVIMIYSVILLIRMKRNLIGVIHLKDNIYLADYINSPFVIGMIMPRIYLPSSLSQKEQEYIILHEQIHIRRGDHIIKWISFLTLCIHWFNPLVWVAFVLSSKDMEMSCDEAVVKKLGWEICQEYSASLLRLATGKRIIIGTPLAFGEGNTKSRIKNVLKWKKPNVWISVLAVIFCLVAIVGCVGNPKTNIDSMSREQNQKENDNVDDESQLDVQSTSQSNENTNSEILGLDSVTSISPRQAEYGSVEDVAFYFELSTLGKTFQDMNEDKMEHILKEYEGLLENYTLIARESTDGTTAYIVGTYNDVLENSSLYMKYSMEFGIGEDETVQILYDSKDAEVIDVAITEGNYPKSGIIIKNSQIYFSSDYNIIFIQPRESEPKFDTIFSRYLYTPNGRAYMIDAVSRGIALTGCEEPYIYVYLISEKFGEIAERIPITTEEADAIMAAERVSIPKGFGFCASLHYNGTSTYFTEMKKIPQSVIDIAVEKCNYKFVTPSEIDEPILQAVLKCDWLEKELYAKEEDLERLREILMNAEFGFVGGCGYGARLTITLAGGEKITVFKGCDSCDSMVFGSYSGYFIGDKQNTEFWEMFGLNPETKELID